MDLPHQGFGPNHGWFSQYRSRSSCGISTGRVCDKNHSSQQKSEWIQPIDGYEMIEKLVITKL